MEEATEKYFKLASYRAWSIFVGLLYGFGALALYNMLWLGMPKYMALPIFNLIVSIILLYIVFYSASVPYKAIACMVQKEGIRVPLEAQLPSRFNKGDLLLLFFLPLELFPRVHRLIAWGLIKDVSLKETLFGQQLKIEACLSEDEPELTKTYSVPWPLDKPSEFKTAILKWTPPDNPLYQFAASLHHH